jgi:thioredoxin-dependent peroxiredoxin
MTSQAPASASLPEIGEPAPDFELPDDQGNRRSLSDARGRWLVLYFYPKDDTPGCTREACEFRDAHAEVEQRGAEVWGISVLGSGSKAAFKEKFGLPFTLIADEEHAVAERYGVWVEKENYGKRYMGIQRATLLVDPQGIVRRVWPRVRPEGHAAEVIAALTEEQAARDTK